MQIYIYCSLEESEDGTGIRHPVFHTVGDADYHLPILPNN